MKAIINVSVAIVLCIFCGCQSGEGQTDRKTKIHEYVAQLERKDPAMRREAIARLHSYGVHAKVATPALIKILKDDGDAFERFRAAKALVRIGPEEGVVPAFVAALEDDEALIRQVAADSLGERSIVPAADEVAVRALITALEKDDDTEFRCKTALTLGEYRAEAGLVVPALMAVFAEDENVEVRCAAAYGLGRLNHDAKAAVPLLIVALQESENVDIRGGSVSALGHIDAELEATVSALTAALQDKAASVRSSAAMALWYIGPEAKSAVPALVTALEDKSHHVRYDVTLALANIGPHAQSAVPALIDALREDDDLNVRKGAASALGDIGPKAKSAVPALEEAIESDHHVVGEAAIEALDKIRRGNSTAGTSLESDDR